MPTRLWFRVEDVLPLAEHALACPTHRLTRAQLAAGEHNTPALTLHRTGPEGQLRSNGVPVWHTPHGDEQAAYGGAWRPTASSVPEPDQHLYLPLRHAGPDGRRLIDILRAGRALDRPWLAINTDAGPGCALDTRHVELFDHRADIAPEGARWRPVMVTSSVIDGRDYPALVADGYVAGRDSRLICRFHQQTVRQMAADLAGPWRADMMPGECPLLRFDGTTALLLEEEDIGAAIRLDVDDRYYPDRDGYYSIGAYRWDWQTSPIEGMPVRNRLRLYLSALSGRLRRITAAHRLPRQTSAAGDNPLF